MNAKATDVEKEKIIKFIDSFYDPINGLQIENGILGLVTRMTDKGTIEVMPIPEGTDFDTWIYKYSVQGWWPIHIVNDGDLLEVPFYAKEKLDADSFYQPQVNHDRVVPNLVFSSEEMDELAILQTDLHTYICKSFAEWLVDGGVEEGWDDFQNELKKIGSDRFVEIYDKAFEAMQ